MAGYLFTFSDFESLEECVKIGFYSPIMSQNWSIAAASTLADFITMKPGDNVYFFSKRMVYGVGEITEIEPGVTVAENYPNASLPISKQLKAENKRNNIMRTLEKKKLPEDKVQRWIITFKPSPDIFKNGVDMDDLLSSNPSAFKSLRVFWKRSFIKLDDAENLAFKAAIIRKNLIDENRKKVFNCNFKKSRQILDKASVPIIKPDIKSLVANQRKNDGTLTSEMTLELALLHQLAIGDSSTKKVFGFWDYLNHQVVASPMKAVDYMDRIDIFGYSWVNGYYGEIIEKYIVCELKTGELHEEDVSQVMKYVDWVCNEYANGDYSMIDAFLVGSMIKTDRAKNISDVILRHYITGRRPLVNHSWRHLTLVSYKAEETGIIKFNPKYDYSQEYLE